MSEFLEAVLQHAFMRNAVLTGLLASVACGVVGSFAVVRRITYAAGGIAHCVLGGIGGTVYLNEVHGWEWLDPTYGAIAAALLAAGIIATVSLRCKEREDTIISAMWAIGMAAGVLLLYATPGYQQHLTSYLFGNILMVRGGDLWWIAALDVVVVAVSLAFYKQFLAVCYDEEFARARGIRTELYYVLLLVLTALTVVLLVTVVGIVMVIALLTLPVAVAGHFARRLWQMMVLAAIFSAAFTTAGLAVGYEFDLPAGATVILLAGGVYLLVTAGAGLRSRLIHLVSKRTS